MWLDSLPPRQIRPSLTRPRPTAGQRIERAVLERAGKGATLVRHREMPWSSATFSGSRHSIVLAFTGWEACDSAETVIAKLCDDDFPLPGLLVADVAVTRVDHRQLPEPRLELEIALLLLEHR